MNLEEAFLVGGNISSRYFKRRFREDSEALVKEVSENQTSGDGNVHCSIKGTHLDPVILRALYLDS